MIRLYPPPPCGRGLGQIDFTVMPFEGAIPISVDGGVIYSWWNPLDWVEEGANWVWKGTKATGGWIWDKGKWVYAKITNKCTWIMGGPILAPFQDQIKAAITKAGGCSAEGQAIAVAALTAALAPKLGAFAPFGASVSVGLVVSCACQIGIENLESPPGPPPGQGTKIAGIVAAVVGGGLIIAALARRR